MSRHWGPCASSPPNNGIPGRGDSVGLGEEPLPHFPCGNSRKFPSDKLDSSRTSLPSLVTVPTHPSLLPKAKNTKSVLDVDPAARALLEVSGRIRHSEGLREVPDDQ